MIDIIEEDKDAETSLVAKESQTAVAKMLDTIRPMTVIKKEDQQFLVKHKEHFAQVFEKVHIWRTDTQKRSIISDNYHPTLHSKFHQSILEQKVQLEQSFYLAKDFEILKLSIEELTLDLEELTDSPRDQIKRKKIEIELQYKKYELDQMIIAMNYRMAEVRGWQQIEDELLEAMRAQGMDDESIWTKDAGETEAMFFISLTKLRGLANSTDAGEVNNLISVAKFYVQKVKESGMLPNLKKKCTQEQLESLAFLGY
jgi:hypothetical protein